jgi:pantetheine-phosphate adenylyltransferase
MRVITGTARGRRLRAGRGPAIRPTADKVKGAIFSILASRFSIQSARVLDLFAGSGSLGIEALSRGAAAVTFVDHSAPAVRLLRANLQACRMEAHARILQMPLGRALVVLAGEAARFDGVLVDPPYERGLVEKTLAALARAGLARPGAWVMVEHHVEETPAPAYGPLRLTQTRRYGKTGLAVFVADELMTESQAQGHIRRAVYAGSFDPITNGHLDVIHRAVDVFDEVIVAVAANTSDPAKDRAFFTADERVVMIHEALADLGGRARADRFSGLLVDYCEKIGAQVIIRGLRAVSDFEYEFQMAMMNRHLKPHIETIFMTAGENYFYTASRLVKEVASLGGDVRELLPDSVYQRLLKKLRATR